MASRIAGAVLCLMIVLGTGMGLMAQDRPRAERDGMLLTLAGKVAGGLVRFDRAALEALPRRSIVTSTPWTDRPAEYTGPGLADVLAQAGAYGSTLRAKALNDYSVRIPASDAREFGAILALEADGKRLTVRDKGPIWLMYPLDTDPKLADRRFVERLVWQLNEIVVE